MCNFIFVQWPFNPIASNAMNYCSLLCNLRQWVKWGYIYYSSFQTLKVTKTFILPARHNNYVLHIEYKTASMKI